MQKIQQRCPASCVGCLGPVASFPCRNGFSCNASNTAVTARSRPRSKSHGQAYQSDPPSSICIFQRYKPAIHDESKQVRSTGLCTHASGVPASTTAPSGKFHPDASTPAIPLLSAKSRVLQLAVHVRMRSLCPSSASLSPPRRQYNQRAPMTHMRTPSYSAAVPGDVSRSPQARTRVLRRCHLGIVVPSTTTHPSCTVR